MPMDKPILFQSHRGFQEKYRETECGSDGEASDDRPEQLRQSQRSLTEHNARGKHGRGCAQDLRSSQPPSPTLTKSVSICSAVSPCLDRPYQESVESPPPKSAIKKRKKRSDDFLHASKRSRASATPGPIQEWLSDLLSYDQSEILDEMTQPPAKRPRPTDLLDGVPSQSGDGSDSIVSKDKKYSLYKSANYRTVLETKGSFMHSSKQGMIAEDKDLCGKLFATDQPIPQDTLFDDEHFSAFHANMRGRSEARICVDLHPRIVPSVENLCICGHEEFEGLVEGYNDPWTKSIPFYGPRPQPNHTVGYKWSNFDEQRRRRLNIEPTKRSYYTARDDIYFPFLTAEVKCGKQGLDLADAPNAHSMTVHLRGVVDLARRAGRTDAVHRRVLGFSISHDDQGARVYAHYPELDGGNTTYWRDTLAVFAFAHNHGEERWKCYRFTLNVCKVFAPSLLERLRQLIDELPHPGGQLFGLSAPVDEISVQSFQDDTSAMESQDAGFKIPSIPSSSRGLNAELRNSIQSLQRQLEQERKETREATLMLQTQMEQQRQDMEQARRESKDELAQRRKGMAEQQRELMELLKEQREQIKQQSEQIRILLQK